jgi:cholesterol oxidase
VSFKETMTGPFAMGVQSSEEGAATAQCTVKMHAEVYIPDIAAFVADPTHTGALSGTLDLPPFANGLACPTGVFRLFSPTDQPDTKYMVYELGFTHNGSPYYLAGHKTVRNDPGLDMWKDTTTLYVTLHGGRDASGPVLGAGTLSLGVADLIRLLETVRVTNATDAGQKAGTIATFGKFFLGRLWDTYGHHARGK